MDVGQFVVLQISARKDTTEFVLFFGKTRLRKHKKTVTVSHLLETHPTFLDKHLTGQLSLVI